MVIEQSSQETILDTVAQEDIDNTVGATNENQVETQAQENIPDKSASDKAFASMRVQNKDLLDSNKTMQDTLEALAKAQGIEGDLATIQTQLGDKAINQQAKNDNVPVELLKRLKDLESRDNMYHTSTLRVQADTGFIKLKEEFGLDDKVLLTFAQELDQAKLNPYAVDHVDIRSEFVSRNLDFIVDRKVQEALKRSQNGQLQSSQPNELSGGAGTVNKITSQQGLSTLLNSANL